MTRYRESASSAQLRIGVDIGGTFTDFVVHGDGEGDIRTFKLLSTPANPAEAVLAGLRTLNMSDQTIVVHGSTVATNTLLERKGARTAFLTTAGFEDLLLIGRQTRLELYALSASRPQPLVPPELCFGITERIDYRGCVVTPLDEDELETVIQRLRDRAVEAVAVTFLFSFVNPHHERIVARRLREEGWYVTASHELLPEFREYERASTTVVNAYVSPVLDRYLAELVRESHPVQFHILQSNGGRMSVAQARTQGVRSILSGPAGGVVGAKYVARQAGFDRIITFDMGGTSTDVSLVDEQVPVTSETNIDGLPIRVPVLDIHTVGSGGGSLAWMDSGSVLRVGPHSAGAMPGPICYGRGGDRPTVTDANVVLGRIPVDGFLGGAMSLDREQAVRALDTFGTALRLGPSPGLTVGQAAATGIIAIVNAQMERAIRVMTVERGYDPRDYILVSFGGAGGVHASDLARHLRIPCVLVPPCAATLSALGMLVADVQLDYVQTVMLPGDTSVEELEACAQPVVQRGWTELQAHGIDAASGTVSCELDIRYVGQSFELTVPLTAGYRERFDACHDARYGYSQPTAPVEIVNLRVHAIGYQKPPALPTVDSAGSPDPREALWDRRAVVLDDTIMPVPHYRGALLRPGHRIPGPAVVLHDDTTILVGRPDRAEVDRYGNLVITIGS